MKVFKVAEFVAQSLCDRKAELNKSKSSATIVLPIPSSMRYYLSLSGLILHLGYYPIEFSL